MKPRPREVVAPWRAALRSLRPLRVIAETAARPPASLEELAAQAEAIRRLPRPGDVGAMTRALWRLEKLGYAFGRGGGSLADGSLAPEVLPILHVGLGIAATAEAGLAPARIAAAIAGRSDPACALLPYESVGCIWGVLASRPYRLLFRLVSRERIPARGLPPWRELAGALPPAAAPLLAHGLGRTLYFRRCHLGRALELAARLGGVDLPASARGVAFASAMVNHGDLERALAAGQDLDDPALGEAFGDGLASALVLWEWTFPGFLARFEPAPGRPAALAERARERVDAGRRRGCLTSPFGVAKGTAA